MAEHLKTGGTAKAERDRAVADVVSRILSDVERDGASAVRRYSQELDGWSPATFTVSSETIRRAEESVSDELREHIVFALSQVKGFAEHQRASLTDIEVETLPGVVMGHRHVPITASGAYSPGGRYPLIASSIMTVAVPKVAGVDRVVAAAPPRDADGIFLPQLVAMVMSGADQILCIGGVQALAALAFGIEDVEPVDMIVGAGNAYVAEAKRQLFGRVGIDLLAGPTEIMVIADGSADPALVAADLLGQAEHGPELPGHPHHHRPGVRRGGAGRRGTVAAHMADRRGDNPGLARLWGGDRHGRPRGGRAHRRRHCPRAPGTANRG